MDNKDYADKMPTKLSKRLFICAAKLRDDLSLRIHLHMLCNELLALELCPYKLGQVVRSYSKNDESSKTFVITRIEHVGIVPFYEITGRGFNLAEQRFDNRSTRLHANLLVGATQFEMTNDFVKRCEELFAKNILKQMPVRDDELNFLADYLLSVIDDLSVSRRFPMTRLSRIENCVSPKARHVVTLIRNRIGD